MTPEERKKAAIVMASEGPWDCRRPDGEWIPYPGIPGFDWSECEYRIRPAPAPEPLPCPWCGAIPEIQTTGSWVVTHGQSCFLVNYHCFGGVGPDCSLAKWNRRSPCPTCSDLRERVTGLLAELSEAHGKETMETVKRLRAQSAVQGIPSASCPTCEGNEVRSATFRSARDNAEARAEAAEAKVAQLSAKIARALATLHCGTGGWFSTESCIQVGRGCWEAAICELEGKEHA